MLFRSRVGAGCYRLHQLSRANRIIEHMQDDNTAGLVRLAKVFEMPVSLALLSGEKSNAQVQTKLGNPVAAAIPAAGLATASANSQKEGTLVTAASDPSPLERKLHKLRRNPRKFFADSSNGLVRIFRHLF